MVENDNTPWCPIWSQINAKPTHCLERKCTKFMPFLNEEAKKEAGFEGFCRDELGISLLEDISQSLAVLADIQLQAAEDEGYEGIIETSKKREGDWI